MSFAVPAIIVLAGPADAAVKPVEPAANHQASQVKRAHQAKTTSPVKSAGPVKKRNKVKTLSAARPATPFAKAHLKAKVAAPHITTPAHETGHQAGTETNLRTLTTQAVRRVARPEAASQPARVPLGTFMVTCYDLTGPTASGAMAGPESVAVDPSVIPLGTTIYVPGIGDRIADDTGGMIIGDHIDIWEPTYGQCADWGVRDLSIYRVP
jgi:3D (Asp-Asp-Asp) domain-containing protein